MSNQQLNEGLRPLDLKDLVKTTLEIDTYRSKMGEDKDVCVLSFHVLNRDPAQDLMEFIEKGFNYVLDSDVSSGENRKGEYTVFVELNRSRQLPRQIRELIYGINKLTGIDEWQYKFYKEDTLRDLTEESLASVIPLTPEAYENKLTEHKVIGLKNFFSKTLMDDITLENNIITIHKPFNQKLQLRWLNENDPQAIIEDAPSIDEDSIAEVFWLTKVLGDYEISKFGDRLLFTNGDSCMLLQRI